MKIKVYWDMKCRYNYNSVKNEMRTHVIFTVSLKVVQCIVKKGYFKQ